MEASNGDPRGEFALIPSKQSLTDAQISLLLREEKATPPHHDKMIIARHPQDMKAAMGRTDTETENVEVNVATGIGSAIGVTDIQKSLHTTVALIAMAVAETMARHPVARVTEVQVEGNTHQAAETMVPVVHMERTLTHHRGTESLGMIAEEAGQVGLMGLEGVVVLEGEVIMAAEAMEAGTENEVCHQRDQGELLQI